jgi:hypothetical protein
LYRRKPLHAAAFIAETEMASRPAQANESVQTNAAGQVVLKLNSPCRDGTTGRFG